MNRFNNSFWVLALAVICPIGQLKAANKVLDKSVPTEIHSVTNLSDGSIIVAGETTNNHVIRKITPQSEIDYVFAPNFDSRLTKIFNTVDFGEGRVLAFGPQTLKSTISNYEKPFSELSIINPDGYVDLKPGFLLNNDGPIISLLSNQVGNYWLVGNFTRINDITTFGIAKLDELGNLDSSFKNETKIPFNIKSSEIDSKNNIYLLGEDNELLKFNTTSGFDDSYNPELVISGTIDQLRPLDDGQLYVHGEFDTINGHKSSGLARLTKEGLLNTDFQWNPIGQKKINKFLILPEGNLTLAVTENEFNSLQLVSQSGTFISDISSNLNPVNTILRLFLNHDGHLVVITRQPWENGFVLPLLIKELSQSGKKPEFIIQPKNIPSVTLHGDRDYMFNSLATGYSTTYTWYENGRKIRNFTSQNFHVFTPHNVLGKVYHVLATNQYGSTLSDPVMVEGVIYDSSSISNYKLEVGDDFAIHPKYLDHVKLLKGELFWTLNDELIVGENSDNLLLKNVTLKDSGVYKLWLKHSREDLTLHEVIITVNEAQRLSGKPIANFAIQNYPNGPVRTLSRQFGDLIILGGDFTSLGPHSAYGIARIHIDGSFDTTFQSRFDKFSKIYSTQLLSDNSILVGGKLGNNNGRGVEGIIKLGKDAQHIDSFDLGLKNNGDPVWIKDIEQLDENKFLICGEFSEIKGIRSYGGAIISASGDLITSLEIPDPSFADSKPKSIAQKLNNEILVGTEDSRLLKFSEEGRFLSRVEPNELTSSYLGITDIKISEAGETYISGAQICRYKGKRYGILILNEEDELSSNFKPSTRLEYADIFNIYQNKTANSLILGLIDRILITDETLKLISVSNHVFNSSASQPVGLSMLLGESLDEVIIGGNFSVKPPNPQNISNVKNLTKIWMGEDAPPPLTITKQPESYSGPYLDSLVLSVESNNQDSSVQWYKNNQLIPNANAFSINIVKNDFEKSDHYQARISYNGSTVFSHHATIQMLPPSPPIITLQPSSIGLNFDKKLRFQVEASQAESYQWFKDGFPIPGKNSKSLQLTGSEFPNSPNLNNLGTYHVMVSNKSGDVKSLDAEVLPDIPIEVDNEQPGIREEVTFKISKRIISENTQLYLEHNGVLLGEEIDSTHSITIDSPEKYGSYRIKVIEGDLSVFSNYITLSAPDLKPIPDLIQSPYTLNQEFYNVFDGNNDILIQNVLELANKDIIISYKENEDSNGKLIKVSEDFLIRPEFKITEFEGEISFLHENEDQSLFIGGNDLEIDTSDSISIFKLNSSGEIDPSFMNSVNSVEDIFPSDSNSKSLFVTANSGKDLYRLNNDGQTDTSFNFSNPYDLKILSLSEIPSGKIIAIFENKLELVEIYQNGRINPDYNSEVELSNWATISFDNTGNTILAGYLKAPSSQYFRHQILTIDGNGKLVSKPIILNEEIEPPSTETIYKTKRQRINYSIAFPVNRSRNSVQIGFYDPITGYQDFGKSGGDLNIKQKNFWFLNKGSFIFTGEIKIPSQDFLNAKYGYFLGLSADATPPVIFSDIENQLAITGTDIEVVPKVFGFPLSFQWYKDGNPIPNQTSEILILNETMPWDSGEYQLRASNSAGEMYSNKFNLKIKLNLEKITPDTSEGYSILLDSNIRLNDPDQFEFTWIKDGEVIDEINEPHLFIQEANLDNSGEYAIQIKYEDLVYSSSEISVSIHNAGDDQPNRNAYGFGGFGIGFDGEVTHLSNDNDKKSFVAAGKFRHFDNFETGPMIRIDKNSKVINSFNLPNGVEDILDIAHDKNNKVYTSYLSKNNSLTIVRFDYQGKIDDSLKQMGNFINAAEVPILKVLPKSNDGFYVIGSFNLYVDLNGEEVKEPGIISFNDDGTIDRSFVVNFSDFTKIDQETVPYMTTGLVMPNDGLWLGGKFRYQDKAIGLLKLDADGNSDPELFGNLKYNTAYLRNIIRLPNGHFAMLNSDQRGGNDSKINIIDETGQLMHQIKWNNFDGNDLRDMHVNSIVSDSQGRIYAQGKNIRIPVDAQIFIPEFYTKNLHYLVKFNEDFSPDLTFSLKQLLGSSNEEYAQNAVLPKVNDIQINHDTSINAMITTDENSLIVGGSFFAITPDPGDSQFALRDYYISPNLVELDFDSRSPGIVQQPENLTLNRLSSVARFEIVTGSDPSLKIQWRKNKSILPNENSSILLYRGELSDGDQFDALISNQYGSTLSKTATVNLISMLPFGTPDKLSSFYTPLNPEDSDPVGQRTQISNLFFDSRGRIIASESEIQRNGNLINVSLFRLLANGDKDEDFKFQSTEESMLKFSSMLEDSKGNYHFLVTDISDSRPSRHFNFIISLDQHGNLIRQTSQTDLNPSWNITSIAINDADEIYFPYGINSNGNSNTLEIGFLNSGDIGYLSTPLDTNSRIYDLDFDKDQNIYISGDLIFDGDRYTILKLLPNGTIDENFSKIFISDESYNNTWISEGGYVISFLSDPKNSNITSPYIYIADLEGNFVNSVYSTPNEISWNQRFFLLEPDKILTNNSKGLVQIDFEGQEKVLLGNEEFQTLDLYGSHNGKVYLLNSTESPAFAFMLSPAIWTWDMGNINQLEENSLSASIALPSQNIVLSIDLGKSTNISVESSADLRSWSTETILTEMLINSGNVELEPSQNHRFYRLINLD